MSPGGASLWLDRAQAEDRRGSYFVQLPPGRPSTRRAVAVRVHAWRCLLGCSVLEGWWLASGVGVKLEGGRIGLGDPGAWRELEPALGPRQLLGTGMQGVQTGVAQLAAVDHGPWVQ